MGIGLASAGADVEIGHQVVLRIWTELGFQEDLGVVVERCVVAEIAGVVGGVEAYGNGIFQMVDEGIAIPFGAGSCAGKATFDVDVEGPFLAAADV